MDLKYLLLLYSSSMIGSLIAIVCMLGLCYVMFRDLQRHQPDTLGLSASSSRHTNVNSSSSGDISIVGPQFSSCNLRHQSTAVPSSRPRLASATSSLNSLVHVEPFRLPDFKHSNERGYFQRYCSITQMSWTKLPSL